MIELIRKRDICTACEGDGTTDNLTQCPTCWGYGYLDESDADFRARFIAAMGGVREMTLADIVEPWVWAYHGHVLPNLEVVNFPNETMPLWHSNDTRWHGL